MKSNINLILIIIGLGISNLAIGKVQYKASFESGVDSNVALLPEAQGNTKNSIYFRPGLSAVTQIKLKEHTLQISGSALYGHNLEETVKSSNSLYLGAGVGLKLPGDFFEKNKIFLNNQINYSYLTESSQTFMAQNNLTLSMPIETKIGILKLSLPLIYSTFPQDNYTGATNPSGIKTGVEGFLTHQYQGFYLWESASLIKDFATGDNFKKNILNLNLGARTELSHQILASAYLGYSHSDYTDTSFGRKDNQVSISVGASKKIKELNLGAFYAYSKNNSNFSNGKYSKNVFSIRMSHGF